jgi:glutamine cyclotransferase
MTYKERQVLVYSEENFELLDVLPMPAEIKEGWGMTTDGTYLYVSEGSEKIFVVDPANFTVLKTLVVQQAGTGILMVNELEWIDGEIWGNIFMKEWIVVFSHLTGEVSAWVSLQGLGLEPEATQSNPNAVWNGIAIYGQDLYLTGKLSSYIYKVQVDTSLLTSAPPY